MGEDGTYVSSRKTSPGTEKVTCLYSHWYISREYL